MIQMVKLLEMDHVHWEEEVVVAAEGDLRDAAAGQFGIL